MKVVAIIQSKTGNDAPVEMKYYDGDDIVQAIHAFTTAVAADDTYVMTLSISLEMNEPIEVNRPWESFSEGLPF